MRALVANDPIVFGLAFMLAMGLAAAGLLRRLRRERRAREAIETAAGRLHDEIWELREAAAARMRAEAANEAKSRFLANVSHEVRTPLNGLLGVAELLSSTLLSAEQAAYVAAIRSSGSALASLIDEILDFAKIEAGRIEITHEAFDIVALVESVAELLAPRAQGKALEIASTLEASVPRMVMGDPVRLRQILLNLAGNAVKFTGEGGVGLRVRPAGGGFLRFDVTDTGPGIPDERREAIFEEFEQAGSSMTDHRGGTGLGLPISRTLAERMGGTLELASSFATSPARGATFTLLLPLPAAPQAEAAAGAPDLGGKHVLIVAQSPFEAPFLAGRLREAGARVEEVADETGALSWLQAPGMTGAGPRFDILLVDCALGETATRAIGDAARLAGVPQRLLLFSPFERQAFGQTHTEGFDGWLVKPVRRDSLFNRINPAAAPVGPVFAAWAPDLRTSQAPQPGVRQGHRRGGFNILLAEDNEINALLAIRHFERIGATVTRAPDGLSALALAEAALDAATPYDAIVLDIWMPGLDGIELARRIRQAESARGRPRARIVALTAAAPSQERKAAEAAGIDVFLSKPAGFAQIEQVFAPEHSHAE